MGVHQLFQGFEVFYLQGVSKNQHGVPKDNGYELTYLVTRVYVHDAMFAQVTKADEKKMING